MKHSGFPITISTATIQCEVFENNSEVLKMETTISILQGLTIQMWSYIALAIMLWEMGSN